MINAEQLIEVGKIQKPHGLKGELNVTISDDIFDTVKDCPYLVVDVDGIFVPFFIEEYKFRSDTTLTLKLLDIDTQDDAKEMSNKTLYFDRKCFTAKEAKDYDAYNTNENESFIGYSVTDRELGPLGKIVGIDDQTMNILFIVEYNDNELLIPAVEEFIDEIDDENKVLHLNLPPGLVNSADAISENDD